MRTAAELASEFFTDTGQKKSTNWTRLAAAIEARDAEVRAETIEECAKAAENAPPRAFSFSVAAGSTGGLVEGIAAHCAAAVRSLTEKSKP